MNAPLIVAPIGTAFSATGVVGIPFELPVQRGVRIVVKVSAVSGTSPTLTLKLQAYDGASGTFVDVKGASTLALDATGTTELTVYPGLYPVVNEAVNAHPGRRCQLYGTIGGSNTPIVTASIGVDRLA